ncbi:MAG: hypothetical protein AB7L94_38450 [Kofleriaceae bacterium]
MSNDVRIGALVIGSLFWERERWSRGVVSFNTARDVAAPIRYGRRSESRGLAYTMILSPGSPNGNAKVVPFQKAASTFAHVIDAASELASAEGLSRSLLSSSWGCIGLMAVNESSATIVQAWREHMAARATRVRACYSESPPIDVDGVLALDFAPASLDEFDLLLTTVTAPTPPMPTADQVVDAMNSSDATSNGLRYFRENVRHGITTFQDADITSRLRARNVEI